MRYIIIEKDLGAFVGAIENLAIFAKHEAFGIERIFSFDTSEEAEEYIDYYLNKDDREFSVECVDVKNKYVSVKDIIKAGLGKYTHRMMDNIYMPSETVN